MRIYALRMLLNLAIFLGVFNTAVIPIQFKDRDLQCDRQQVEELAAEAAAYFDRQYRGEKTFNFQVCDPVSLPEDLAYYGANSISRKDEMFYKAVVQACREVDGSVDFKTIDNILILAAGPGEDEGCGEDYVWPHRTLLSDQNAAFKLDGTTIDAYTVCTELCSGAFTGIGKICHETGHALGFPDLYDTDGEGSGGRTDALGGSLSLMDNGYLNGGGHNPPDFTAIEREIAGLGKCIEMKQGTFEMTPGWDYMKLEGEEKGEYYLVEYVEGRGILRYHIDKSGNSAGVSSLQGKTVTAARRWELNEINCNPDYPCACLSDDFSFRCGGPAPFHISRTADGRFEVIEAISIDEMEIYQDGAALIFSISDKMGAEPKVEWLSLSDSHSSEVEFHEGKYRSVISERLEPAAEYRLRISSALEDGGTVALERNFVTKYYREGSIPFIVLRACDRNSDGSFIPGSEFPLKVYNAPEALGTIWYFNGMAIMGKWFKIESSGTLKAEVILSDGTTDFIMKEIKVK